VSFPEEIIAYRQWVCWTYALTDGKQTKLPLNPTTGHLASVTDPLTWSDYATAVYSAQSHNCGIGFVLSKNDPFCFIDFDDCNGDPVILDRQRRIAEAMDSYSEFSPSGKGLHIIVKAEVPGGRRRDKIEIYSADRYMTMTGNTVSNKPIAERNYLANLLWSELSPNHSFEPQFIVEQPEQFGDDFIYSQALNAENGDKFETLWTGDWQKYYQSQSEADFALINILGFYSRNMKQIERMFMISALGQRDKAKRKDYVRKMIQRSFDNMPPMIPIEDIKKSVANQLARQDAKKDEAAAIEAANPFAGPLFQNLPDPNYDWTMPPGLLGEITNFIYSAAVRPVKEIALAAAIGLMAGICGRAYNVSGTGLNQYVLILAKTGTGKEGAQSGISRLMERVKIKVPSAMDFIGPSEIASGQALEKYLGKNPCFLSIVGEFGLALQQMCSLSANLSQVTLRRALLKLYNKSGVEDNLQPTIYADKDKNTQVVKSPSFSLLGESTPETFYVNMDENMIQQGLFPRFTVIEYLGERPKLNKNHDKVQPTPELLNRLEQLCAACLMMSRNSACIKVELDTEAQSFADAFNQKCDAKINTSEFEVARQLWNRAHVKMLKLAALIAIGINDTHPVINLEAIKWSALLVERDCMNILKQFETGKAGKDTGELNQINELVNVIGDFFARPGAAVDKYCVDPRMPADNVIPHAFLQRRLLQRGAFKNDRLGAINALKRTVDSLISDGSIRAIREMDLYKRYGKTMKAYVVVDVERFYAKK
jgi:hypothetical protein